MVDIKKYFPNIYDGILEIDALANSENALFNNLEREFNKILLNQFVLTCDANTINKYESLFKIVPDSSKDLEFRRSRVLNRLAMSNSFTLRFLEEKLDELIGLGKYKVEIDYNNHILYVESISLNQDWFNETYITINKIKPANMVFINRPRIDERIIENEEVTYSQREYNYRLGTRWRLGEKPFKSLNEKGALKLRESKSATEELLGSLRSFTLNKIHHARINNTLIINTFITKELKEKSIIIQYAVLKNDISTKEITKVEIMDVDNKILTTINIYIPIIEDLEIKHVLNIEEGVIPNAN
ncbi:putative phage tail protein [Clostridium cadaveris]|uniref:putative phage tail protein n=1 Tax=Clostridium cadaveris TaxID=1529 RepID=UPI000C089BCA|nr:putative phage tail protein [Clostridium cadaveris]